MESILAKDKKSPSGIIYCDFSYEISISDLARKIMDFSKNRSLTYVNNISDGLDKSYIQHFSPIFFS